MGTMPVGWERVTTAEGETYYFNHATGATSWDLPSAVPMHAPMVAPSPAATLCGASEDIATTGGTANEVLAGAAYVKRAREYAKGQLAVTRPDQVRAAMHGQAFAHDTTRGAALVDKDGNYI